MGTKILGLVETEIYTSDDGLVAIEQPNDTVVLLSVDQSALRYQGAAGVIPQPRRVQEPARE